MKGTNWVRLGFLAGLLALGSGQAALANGAADSAGQEARAFGTPVSVEHLADQRGGARSLTMNLDQIQNEINENAALTDNYVGNNVATGANSISGGSFAGSSGISSVIQNSGNNVIIQDSTLVNITMQP